MNIDLKTIKKAYFLGLGGIGVSAVARMLLLEGKAVSGSDMANSELLDILRQEGVDVFIGQDVGHIPLDVDLVIYTIAIEKFAPDFMENVRQKIGRDKVISYPESLSIISKDKYTIAICGTHGKTTTTAMVAKIMMDAGLDPTVIVGSIMSDTHSNFVAGKSKLVQMPNGEMGGYLVVEACEYCRSFININPTIVGITTIDNDHMDYYKDSDDIKEAFSEFVGKASVAVAGDLNNEKIKKVIENYELRITNYEIKSKIIDSSISFDNNLKLKIPGEHNRKNASVALSIAEFLGIPKNSAIASLQSFSGTWRRFEYKGKTMSGAIVYDDYAHHPTEISATLAGVRELYPDKKIIVVFQPHLYSRTKLLFADFVDALSKADNIILTPIYAAREVKDDTVLSELLAEAVKKQNINCIFLETFKEIKSELQKDTDEKNVIVVMGAGDISKLADILI